MSGLVREKLAHGDFSLPFCANPARRRDPLLVVQPTALAHSRGWLDYEERVATYRPEFAQSGKENITVRQLLAHQAGLFAFDEPVDRKRVDNPDQLAGRDGAPPAGVGARTATGLPRADTGVL